MTTLGRAGVVSEAVRSRSRDESQTSDGRWGRDMETDTTHEDRERRDDDEATEAKEPTAERKADPAHRHDPAARRGLVAAARASADWSTIGLPRPSEDPGQRKMPAQQRGSVTAGVISRCWLRA